jgi:Ca2+-binding RTX toxin-like protein
MIRGTQFSDTLYGTDGADSILGLNADDVIYGGAGNDIINGGRGADVMYGGSGDDVYYIDYGLDSVIEDVDGGIDTIFVAEDMTIPDNVENMNMNFRDESGLILAVTGFGNSLGNVIIGNDNYNYIGGYGEDDTIYGRGGFDILYGGDGNDRLIGGADLGELYGEVGNDILIGAGVLDGGVGDDLLRGTGELRGGDGDDRLFGGHGRDVMTGGNGADSFAFDDNDFAENSELGSDVITDFSSGSGDRVRVNLVDANTANGVGDDRFTFIGTDAFSQVAGQLRYQIISGNTYVMGDQTGDGTADFWVRLDGVHALVATDFVL